MKYNSVNKSVQYYKMNIWHLLKTSQRSLETNGVSYHEEFRRILIESLCTLQDNSNIKYLPPTITTANVSTKMNFMFLIQSDKMVRNDMLRQYMLITNLYEILPTSRNSYKRSRSKFEMIPF